MLHKVGSYFDGDPTTDPYDFLDWCHEILRNLGMVESNRVNFTTFQLIRPVKRWWQAYERGKTVISSSLTWN